jgi:hypothetical protein
MAMCAHTRLSTGTRTASSLSIEGTNAASNLGHEQTLPADLPSRPGRSQRQAPYIGTGNRALASGKVQAIWRGADEGTLALREIYAHDRLIPAYLSLWLSYRILKRSMMASA